MMIDTHSHIYDADYDLDFNEVVQRALDAGVEKVVMPAIDMESYQRMMDVAEKLPKFAYPSIGLHPTSVKENWKEELSFVENKLKELKFWAVGEIGLDGYWSKEFIQEQKEVFFRQIELADSYHLPVIIHLRDATNELFEVLERVKQRGLHISGVFHAFTGSIETYHRIMKYGDFMVGIGGVVTYKKAEIANTLVDIPLDRIILETDAPWLTPVPYRGKRNESSYLKFIATKVAEIKGCDFNTIQEITTSNTLRLFNLQ